MLESPYEPPQDELEAQNDARMRTYTEFTLAVTVWSLEEPDDQPCAELQTICQLLEVPEVTRSLAELYPSSKPIRLLSSRDPHCFLNIDLGPDDGMDVVGIQLRCLNPLADEVEKLLRQIRSRSEVKNALLRGNLGLPSYTDANEQ